MIKWTFHVTACMVVAIVIPTFAGGCAETIIASEKPSLPCANGDEVIPVEHYRGTFKWQCGRAPTKCGAGRMSKFFIANNHGPSGSDGIRWECLRAEEQHESDVLAVPFRKLDARVQGTAISATLSSAMRCRKAWLDGKNIVREDEGWKACQREPIGNEPITVKVGDSTLRATTNAKGKATFDLTGVKPNDALISTPIVQLLVVGNVMTMVSSSVDLTNSELFPLWKETVKLAMDSTYVDQIEVDIAGIERILTNLEGTKESWGDSELEEARRVSTLFNDMQQNIAALSARKPIDPALDRRFGPLAPRVGTLSSRAQALMPRAKKAAEARNMRNAAFLSTLLGSSASPSFGGGSTSSTTSDAQLRETEERHQRERSDEQRRHQQERERDARGRKDDEDRRDRDERDRRETDRRRSCTECSQARQTCDARCADADKRCGDACGHGSSRWGECVSTTCAPQVNACKTACYDDSNACRSRNHCGG